MDINNKSTGDNLTATEFNQLPNELEALIAGGGITPSDADNTQVLKSLVQLAMSAEFMSASGTANAITLSAISPRIAPQSLVDGLKVRFIAGLTNTDACTVKVGLLSAKSLKMLGSDIQSGIIVAGRPYEAIYSASNDCFELLINVKQVEDMISAIKTGVLLGTCSTASATTEKAVTIDGVTALTAGLHFVATFSNANTASNPTININSLGAKGIKNLGGDVITYIPANIPLDFMYNGTDIIALYTNTFSIIPDYSKSVSKTVNIEYTAQCDGWLIFGAGNTTTGQTNTCLLIDGATRINAYHYYPNQYDKIPIPIQKGSTYQAYRLEGTANVELFFVPMKGAS